MYLLLAKVRYLSLIPLNLSDSVPYNVMPLVYETVKQYVSGPSSTILVLTRGSSRKQVKQVIANIQSPLHGYHHRETIDITYNILHMHLSFRTC